VSLTDTPVDRAEAVEMLSRINDLTAYIKEMTEERDALKDQVKRVLEENPDPLVDGERGLVATLKPRRLPAVIDLITFSQKPEAAEVLAEAGRMGFLNALLTPLRAQKGKSAVADVLLNYEMNGGESHVLTIERVG
jgi:alkylation response protein AidB-like acyl-CoA dehydrogenase